MFKRNVHLESIFIKHFVPYSGYCITLNIVSVNIGLSVFCVPNISAEVACLGKSTYVIHSSVDGHLGCIHVLAIVNSAAMNNGIHVSFSVLVSSGYMPRSGIAGSYGGSTPSFLRKWYIYTMDYYSAIKGIHLSQFW